MTVNSAVLAGPVRLPRLPPAVTMARSMNMTRLRIIKHAIMVREMQGSQAVMVLMLALHGVSLAVSSVWHVWVPLGPLVTPLLESLLDQPME